jgi:hypothetical protein
LFQFVVVRLAIVQTFERILKLPWIVLVQGALRLVSDATVNATIGFPPHSFFLKGDGHRKPPFQWATSPPVKLHFLQKMANNALCFHVEEQQSDVRAESIPAIFNPVFTSGKVFGWELSIYIPLLPLMSLIMDMPTALEKPQYADIEKLHNQMVDVKSKAVTVGNPAWMVDAIAKSAEFLSYWKSVLRYFPPPAKRNEATELAYIKFLLDYNKRAMQLRTEANNYIAINITKSVNLYPNDTHLITLGDAHLTNNPVQQYLSIGAAIGVVDIDQF